MEQKPIENNVNSINQQQTMLTPTTPKQSINNFQSEEETPNPISVAEETPNPVSVVEETPNPVSVVEETPNPVSVTEETPNPVSVTEETPNPVSVTEETPNPVSVTEEKEVETMKSLSNGLPSLPPTNSINSVVANMTQQQNQVNISKETGEKTNSLPSLSSPLNSPLPTTNNINNFSDNNSQKQSKDNLQKETEEKVKDKNVEEENREKDLYTSNKISLNTNSKNNLNVKSKREINSFTEKGEKAQKRFVNSLSNFFS
jgi:hypothetical protein